MLTRLLRRCGFTRDMRLWLWMKLLGLAGLVSGGIVDVHGALLDVGINASDLTVHRIIGVCGLIMFLGGQYSTSHLDSTDELHSVTPPKEKTA